MSDKTDDSDNLATGSDLTDRHSDSETILMALDQISQTIDVMTSVVGRLRHFVEEQELTQEAELREAMRPDRVLH
jgi:hypothetical protein